MEGGLLGGFMDWRSLPEAAATALGLIAVDLVVWAKPNAGDGDLYRSAHELLPLFKKGTASHVHHDPDGKRGRRRSNLWTTPEKVSSGPGRRPKLQDGPAGKPGKPTRMLADTLMELTDRDDIILDPFLCAGSTLIAAENTARVCYGVESDPRYVDVILRRYQTSTGTAATLTETGETFEQVAARRRGDECR
jgi:DNA modification methylase